MTFKYSIKNIIVFLVVFLLQILVFNNVNVYGVGFPMIYPMAILLIPIVQPAWWVLIFAFFTGLSIDFFTDTGGIHAAATTLLGFARIFVLHRLEPQAGYHKEDRPGFANFRMNWVLPYFLMLITLHHLFYFFLEEANFMHIGEIILKTVVSSMLSVFFILLLNIFIFRR